MPSFLSSLMLGSGERCGGGKFNKTFQNNILAGTSTVQITEWTGVLFCSMKGLVHISPGSLSNLTAVETFSGRKTFLFVCPLECHWPSHWSASGRDPLLLRRNRPLATTSGRGPTPGFPELQATQSLCGVKCKGGPHSKPASAGGKGLFHWLP